MENHCVKIQLHSDFLYYFAFYKYKQLCLTIIIRSFTSKHSIQAPRRPCKWGRHEILRTPHVCGRVLRMTSLRLQGLRPCTPFCECEHRLLDNYLCILTYCFFKRGFVSTLTQRKFSLRFVSQCLFLTTVKASSAISTVSAISASVSAALMKWLW